MTEFSSKFMMIYISLYSFVFFFLIIIFIGTLGMVLTRTLRRRS